MHMLGVQFSQGFLTILLDLDSSSLSSKEVKKKKETKKENEKEKKKPRSLSTIQAKNLPLSVGVNLL